MQEVVIKPILTLWLLEWMPDAQMKDWVLNSWELFVRPRQRHISLRRPKLPTSVNQPKTPKKGHFGRWEISEPVFLVIQTRT